MHNVLFNINQQLLEDTWIITVTDHGGGGAHPNDHGSDHPMDMTITWGITGPGVKPAFSMHRSASWTRPPSSVMCWGCTHRIAGKGRYLKEYSNPENSSYGGSPFQLMNRFSLTYSICKKPAITRRLLSLRRSLLLFLGPQTISG
ncbi:hypothetical protein [Paenibacillus sp. ISL-20]|uniref:hypothetical protein n=1 Tax=Paenibacillus sp. ISL-20 TaxID=2819163 RepID=UPI00203530E5|nr:hypothetical protein [Paenibacillus sp. ISL-20]